MEQQTNQTEATQAAPETPQTQPKRVLTEVQRLAFMKGREKRLANIERRKQEKLEEEQSAEAPEEHIPEHIPEPIKPLFNEDEFATKIATIVMERLESKIVPPPTPVKPKRKYTKRVEPPPPPAPVQTPPPPPVMKQFSWI